MKFSTAIFDMDGLLLDSERVCMACFETSCRSIGVKADVSVYMRCIGSNMDRTREILIEGHSGFFPYDEIHRRWIDLYEEEVCEKPVPLKPGVTRLLNRFADAGTPMSVATSTPYDLAITKLKNSGLVDYFDFVVAGDHVSKSKPDPEIYLLSARKHKKAVEFCIAFEDSENGVRSAHNAGISVVQVPDIVKPTDSLRSLGHQIVDSLDEVVWS